jgi:hypothetical protein
MDSVKTHFLTLMLFLTAAVFAWAAKDSCFDCHLVQKGPSPIFKDDIHYKYGVSCDACHGGDRNEDRANAAMADAKGMKPRVMRGDVPDFCGTCHSDPAFIGKYKKGQRTDQLALYRKGVHGTAFAKGNMKAAQCVDCHSVHNTRAVSDPQSVVYPTRLADRCGNCHAEEAKLFKQSPHAKVFATSSMAACAACHKSHDTAPAGVAQLTGAKPVCARCHPPSSAAGKSVAAMAKKIAGLAPGDQRASAIQAAHGLKLAP